MPLYWPLSTLAAIAALFELAVRPHYWAKTKHGVSARARVAFTSREQRAKAAPIRQSA